MADEIYTGPERRRFVRVNGRVKVHYTILSTEVEKTYHTEIESIVHNIGAGGICFDGNEFLAVGTLLKMEIELPGKEEPIQAFGKLIWQKQVKEKVYRTGVAFFWIIEEDRKAIMDYAEKAKTRYEKKENRDCEEG